MITRTAMTTRKVAEIKLLDGKHIEIGRGIGFGEGLKIWRVGFDGALQPMGRKNLFRAAVAAGAGEKKMTCSIRDQRARAGAGVGESALAALRS